MKYISIFFPSSPPVFLSPSPLLCLSSSKKIIPLSICVTDDANKDISDYSSDDVSLKFFIYSTRSFRSLSNLTYVV